jgi:formylglycine-generating enzyme required for sulfatase activity
MKTLKTASIVTLFLSTLCLANSAPQVSNVRVSQRSDDSRLVDIYYNLAEPDGDLCTVWVLASDNGGLTWSLAAISLSGAVGENISAGTNKHIIWDAGADMPAKTGYFKVRVFADDGTGGLDMVLVPAGAFKYQHSTWTALPSYYIGKYETTVSQYCEFLNSADPGGTYWDERQEIMRYGDAGNYYYAIAPSRGNYPIRYVSYNDAVAYAAWKSSSTGLSYRLPTEQEWEKAAGWNPVLQKLWTYGFQQDTISSLWCNYNGYYYGPLEVGSFNGTGGKNNAKSYYGCYDMSGNVWEWTSSWYTVNQYRVIRGGDWYHDASFCEVSYRYINAPTLRYYDLGFRLVLDLN